jgi:hypothetical protein
MTRYPREEIFAALFAQAQLASTATTPFAVLSRRYVPFSERTDLEDAELYQVELNQTGKQTGHFGLTKWDMKALWVCYFPVDTDDLKTLTSPTLNNYLDALEAAMQPVTGAGPKQTLGGLVNNAFIDGDVIIDEGLNSGPPALISIPITINVGM